MAKGKMVDLKNKDLSLKLKLKIMKVLVWTTVTYGAEGWTLKSDEKIESKLQKCGFTVDC